MRDNHLLARELRFWRLRSFAILITIVLITAVEAMPATVFGPRPPPVVFGIYFITKIAFLFAFPIVASILITRAALRDRGSTTVQDLVLSGSGRELLRSKLAGIYIVSAAVLLAHEIISILAEIVYHAAIPMLRQLIPTLWATRVPMFIANLPFKLIMMASLPIVMLFAGARFPTNGKRVVAIVALVNVTWMAAGLCDFVSLALTDLLLPESSGQPAFGFARTACASALQLIIAPLLLALPLRHRHTQRSTDTLFQQTA